MYDRFMAREKMIIDYLDSFKKLTAIICYNAEIYYAVEHLVIRRGYKIPEGLSLCCFAADWECNRLYPPTAMIIPCYQMGEKSVDCLMGIIEGKQEDNVKNNYITTLAPILRPGCTTARL